MKKTRNIVISIVIIMIFLTGCGLWGDKTCARTIKNPSEMPEIVFVYHICHLSTANSRDDAKCSMAFYDKNGNYYVSENTKLCSLSAEELIKEYAEGNLNDQIELHMIGDAEEIFANYKKLCKVSKNNKFEMVYPEEGPESIEDEAQWYGIYYDKEGNVQTLIFHESDAHGSHYSNDERANEIYEWYTNSFRHVYDINYSIESETETGYQGVITIKNNSQKTVEKWMLGFKCEDNISYVQNAVIDSNTSNYYIIKGEENTENIDVNETISINFYVRNKNYTKKLESFKLYVSS